MKHVVNWTIGSFFRTIGRIIAYLIVGALIAFAFSYKPKAATLTTYDSYQLYWNGQSGCGSSNKYSYTTYAISAALSYTLVPIEPCCHKSPAGSEFA